MEGVKNGVGCGGEENFPMDERQPNIQNLDSMVAMLSMSKDPGCDNGGIDSPDEDVSDEISSDSSDSSYEEYEREQERKEAAAAAVAKEQGGARTIERILEDESSSCSSSTVARTHSTMGNRHVEQNIDGIDQSLPNDPSAALPTSSQSFHMSVPYLRSQRPLNHSVRPKSRNQSVGNSLITSPRQRLSPAHQHPIPPIKHDTSHLREEFTTANHPSCISLSTATHTAASVSLSVAHATQMPMCLPNFRPATGCTNASDFIVRCFVARLRVGIIVTKHARSRWCKSRLRILHIHSDGKCLSWKPAKGETASSKRPPRLDLTTCIEVRHAWTPDPLNPMFTGTGILRQKCEVANAFKSFALIFGKRTVDITAVTADQCKVLMEGFSALCYRLQVASSIDKGSCGSTSSSHEEEERRGGSVGDHAKSNGNTSAAIAGGRRDAEEPNKSPSMSSGAMAFGR